MICNRMLNKNERDLMQHIKKFLKRSNRNPSFFFPKKTEYLLEQDLYIDPTFFKTGLQDKYLLGTRFEKIKVSKLRRKNDNGPYPLHESPLYKYLNERQKNGKTDKQFEELIQNIEKKGFNSKSYILCKYRSNLIKDGQHRAIYMLWKYGPDYEINVLHIRVKNDLLRFKIFPWLKKLT